MGALDEPVRTLVSEPTRRRLHLLLCACETCGCGTYLGLHDVVSRAEGGTVRQALAGAGIHDLVGVPEQVRVFEEADRVSNELADAERKLLELSTVNSSSGDPFVSARRLSPRYQGPEGRQRFELDGESDADLVEHLEQQARQARSRNALNARLRKLAADVNDINTAPGTKLRLLERHRSEGLKELEAATGNARQLVRPVTHPGGLRRLEAGDDLAARQRLARELQAEINRMGWNS